MKREPEELEKTERELREKLEALDLRIRRNQHNNWVWLVFLLTSFSMVIVAYLYFTMGD